MKKKYTKPYLAAENFEPQEYCAPCTKPYSVTQLSGWNKVESNRRVYIDVNGDGDYDMGEAFDPITGQSKASTVPADQTTSKEVGIFYLTRGSSTSYTQDNHGFGIGDTYQSHTYNGYDYLLRTISTEIIVIKNRYAYVKTMS